MTSPIARRNLTTNLFRFDVCVQVVGRVVSLVEGNIHVVSKCSVIRYSGEIETFENILNPRNQS